MISPVVAVLRILGFALVMCTLLPPYALAGRLGWRGHAKTARRIWSIVARVVGFNVRTHGTPLTEGPALFVANHASYLDIIVLGSQLPIFFVAKAEVSDWPFLGWMSRVARTAFIERKRGSTGEHRDMLRSRLEDGEMMLIFPEGTSNDGNRVLPFKSSLFAVAEKPLAIPGGGTRPLPVQPVSVAYTRLDGLPLQRAFRPFYAWYGDMTLAGHMFQALGLGRVTIDVIYHPAVTIADFRDRKGLSNHCHDVINHGVTLALAGRLPEDGSALLYPHPAPVLGVEVG